MRQPSTSACGSFPKVCKNHDTHALKEFEAFGTLADDFWARRNEEMTRNIIRHSKEFRGQRIVVLCGYEHRYYLRKRPREQEPKENFVLREYWTY